MSSLASKNKVPRKFIEMSISGTMQAKNSLDRKCPKVVSLRSQIPRLLQLSTTLLTSQTIKSISICLVGLMLFLNLQNHFN